MILQIPKIADVILIACKISNRQFARILNVLLSYDKYGYKAAAVILEAMSPVAAVNFLYDIFDLPIPLLPVSIRKQLLAVSGQIISNAQYAVQHIILAEHETAQHRLDYKRFHVKLPYMHALLLNRTPCTTLCQAPISCAVQAVELAFCHNPPNQPSGYKLA